MPPPANPVVIGDSGLPFGSNLVALPWQNASCPCQPTVKLSLPAQGELVAVRKVAPAAEHRLAARAIAAAVEFKGEYPCARSEVQVRHERNRTHRLAFRNRIELVEQCEESLGLIPRVTNDRF